MRGAVVHVVCMSLMRKKLIWKVAKKIYMSESVCTCILSIWLCLNTKGKQININQNDREDEK